MTRLSLLPTNSDERKAIPLCRGVLDYFPLALAEVARVSMAGNDQHNPGEPLHWSREKSPDHADCILRHLMERGQVDSDGMRSSAKLAWRALALLQLEMEAAREPWLRPYEETFVKVGDAKVLDEAIKIGGTSIDDEEPF